MAIPQGVKHAAQNILDPGVYPRETKSCAHSKTCSECLWQLQRPRPGTWRRPDACPPPPEPLTSLSASHLLPSHVLWSMCPPPQSQLNPVLPSGVTGYPPSWVKSKCLPRSSEFRPSPPTLVLSPSQEQLPWAPLQRTCPWGSCLHSHLPGRTAVGSLESLPPRHRHGAGPPGAGGLPCGPCPSCCQVVSGRWARSRCGSANRSPNSEGRRRQREEAGWSGGGRCRFKNPGNLLGKSAEGAPTPPHPKSVHRGPRGIQS